jgi:circadian clock protein KaiC
VARISRRKRKQEFPKARTGIAGLDEVTQGGLPRGRPTLVSGRAGCGKTVLGLEFIVRGAVEFNEPGVIVTFEETPEELAENVRSFGFDLDELIAEKKISIEYVQVERESIAEAGDYNLDGLFVRLAHAIEKLGAKRMLLDTIESLFSGLTNLAILRAELRRLFRFLKDRGVTVIITGEQGEGMLTRQGLEEYVSDCVIALSVQITHHIATRMLRIVKYRGSSHSGDECPFLITRSGFSVLPITSLGLAHEASSERISSGNDSLDELLSGEGFYRGSSILVSGGSGSGKTSISAGFAASACKRGERCMYFAFEESPHQLMRNMRSIGIDLQPYLKKGLLWIEATRPSLFGLEMHLATTIDAIARFKPQVVIIDPITDFVSLGTSHEVRSMMTRLVDYLKSRGITAMMTSLTTPTELTGEQHVGISSLIDTWIVVQQVEVAGERNRGISVLKSRGMAHSNKVREFTMGPSGLKLIPAYRGGEGFLSGSAREAAQAADALQRSAR